MSLRGPAESQAGNWFQVVVVVFEVSLGRGLGGLVFLSWEWISLLLV